MKIKCVTIAIDYDDLLKITLPITKRFVDKLLVTTTPNDALTHRLCESHGVEWIGTNAWYDDGAPFNRGKGMNVGIRHLDLQPDDWLLIIDADIVIPEKFAEIKQRKLDPQYLYSIHRFVCPTKKEYDQYLIDGDDSKFYCDCFHDAPIGCFQLAAVASGHRMTYGEHLGTSEFTDTQFSYQWNKKWKWLDAKLIHLGVPGTNFTSKTKGPRFE